MKLVKYGLAFLVAITSNNLLAAGTVNFLEVNNDVVLFSTTETKTVVSPTCMASDNANLWSVSLATSSGSAIYSMILTAMANGPAMELVVESANDCNASNGFERASTVRTLFQPQHQAQSGGGHSIGLYKFGGVERIGTVTNTDYPNVFYADKKGGKDLSHIDLRAHPLSYLYFSESNCQGIIRSNTNLSSQHAEFQGDLRFFRAQKAHTHTTYQSFSRAEQCINQAGGPAYLYEVDYSAPRPIDPLCGEGPCIIKEDP